MTVDLSTPKMFIIFLQKDSNFKGCSSCKTYTTVESKFNKSPQQLTGNQS